MSGKNGYFQLVVKNGATYISFFPPEGDGERLNASEVIQYLNKHHIPDVDVRKINHCIMSVKDEPAEMIVCDKEVLPERQSLSVQIAEDKMSAIARFYPASNQGEVMTVEDIVSDLVVAGVKFGIRKEIVEKFLKEQKYCTDYEIAVGKEPVQGEDAVITYLFNTEIGHKPKENDDGSVDFHNLNNIARVVAGDILAQLKPEVPGVPGMTVTGEPIKPRDVKKLKLRYGKNIERSEDKLTLKTLISGHASLVNDQVFVSDVFEVEDVDVSTGDIVYDGNVMVKGNVRSGFLVKANGNIDVNGVVEGAKLISEGDILIKRGIQGMGKADLQAKGNVVAKFIENATVEAGGFVRTDAVLHSRVSAKGDIEVDGKKGFITGGVVRSTNLISAKSIGSPMGTATVIEVGVDPILKERLQVMEREIAESEKIISTAKPVVIAFGKRMGAGEKMSRDQLARAQMLQRTIDENEKRIIENCKEVEEIRGLLELETEATVRVRSNLYPGTKITISDVSYFVKDNMGFCRFTKEQGEVKWHSM